MAKNQLTSIDDYPATLDIDEDKLPAIKDWKIDQECTLEVKVRVKSLNKPTYSKSNKLRATLEVISVKSDDVDPHVKGMDSVKIDKQTKR